MLSPRSHTRDSNPCQHCGQPGDVHSATGGCPGATPNMIDVVGIDAAEKPNPYLTAKYPPVNDARLAMIEGWVIEAKHVHHYDQSNVWAHHYAYAVPELSRALGQSVATIAILTARAEAAEAKLALIRATATRSVPMLINLGAIDRILNEKEVRRG